MVTPTRPRPRPAQGVDAPAPPPHPGIDPPAAIRVRRAVSGRLTASGEIALNTTIAREAATGQLPDGSRTPEHLFRPALARAARQRMRYRRRRAAVLALLIAAAGLVTADLVRGGEPPADHSAFTTGAVTAQASGPPRAAPSKHPVRAPGARPSQAGSLGSASAASPRRGQDAGPGALEFPVTGPGTWSYAPGSGPVLGRAGTLRRFRVAVENGAGQDAIAFASAIEAVFADPRGWAASGQLRWQRVPKQATAEFTIFLATPGTSERMCATGGLRTEGFTNCRLPGKVVINLARWRQAVPGYGAPIAEYRAYAINHEVGHQLGHGHEGCPGKGRPAPVMQQQTLAMRGCLANGWPYRDGRPYTGPPLR